MKRQEHQITLSESTGESQQQSAEKRPIKDDAVFARLRRLEQRVNHLEANLSTIRRDLNRVDRQVYRQVPGSRAVPTPAPDNGHAAELSLLMG